ncbi:uncharacterized protein LOC108095731 [Drosophila ficusphila]|uniref:uncharacterized protein LOC108095731 n=1 Tax=Drosophila ficusphila TaxID=30025 RepID=UPI0007E722CA|nr:uncharacterized protein LOC108095731 [Drosophila ficusphila]
MNFSWLAFFILAIFAVAVSANRCPAPFNSEGGKCTAQRTIRGECPHGSQYSAKINKCVYKN